MTAMLLGAASAAVGAGTPGASDGGDPSARSQGCGKPARSGAFTLAAVDGNKKPRTYLMEVPVDYSPLRAYPLIFVFHGGGGSGAQSAAWGLQHAGGALHSAIFAFPNGIAFQREGIGWDDRKDGYDLPFFDNMLLDLDAGYCIDPRKIFVAGFSWGADFAIVLACHRGNQIRAIAANSTSDEFRDTSNYLTYRGLPCGTTKHPAVRFVHAAGGDSEYPPPDFATTSKLFQYLNSCGSGATPLQSSGATMSCLSFIGCASELIECSFDHRIGHTIPPNWAEDTWRFFADFAR